MNQSPSTSTVSTVNLTVQYPETSSKLFAFLGLLFLKGLLLLPHILILGFLGVASFIVTYFNYFWILFTGKYNRSIFDFTVSVQAWGTRVNAWFLSHTDIYPPFSFSVEGYPAEVHIGYPEKSSRLLGLLGIFFPIKLLILLPHLVISWLLQYVTLAIASISFIFIIFSGVYPKELFDFSVGLARWNLRIGAFLVSWTDKYPPFSLK